MSTNLCGSLLLLVAGRLCLLALGLFGSAVLLVAYGKAVPGELLLAAGNCSGRLMALLGNTKHDAPADVNVVNDNTNPVPLRKETPREPADHPPADRRHVRAGAADPRLDPLLL